MNILFIDDEPQCVELAAATLYHDFPGCTIQTATGCETGTCLLESNAFDVAIVDQTLIGILGIDCVRMIRQQWKHLPIVMLTGFWREGFQEECMAAGADGFVNKNAMKQMLPQAVAGAIKYRRELMELDAKTADREAHLDRATDINGKIQK